jgi:hypothetical protein
MPPGTVERPPIRRGRGRLTARRAVSLAFLAAICTLTVTTGSMARPPATPASLDPDAFQAVAVADSLAGTTLRPRTIDAGTSVAPAQIGDFQDEGGRTFEPRANPKQPARAESVVKATPRPTPPPNPTHNVSGRAAWYCQNGSGCPAGYSGGLYAAAGAALRVGNWRGRTVTVCGAGNCVNVTLVDWCACGGDRVIDLFGDAYRRVAPLSSGTVAVRVTW